MGGTRMDFAEFTRSLQLDEAPRPAGLELSPQLLALWQDARGRWDDAHRTVQAHDDAASAQVHAYLHRVEGDLANARYWYTRAGVEPCDAALEEEWQQLVLAHLADTGR